MRSLGQKHDVLDEWPNPDCPKNMSKTKIGRIKIGRYTLAAHEIGKIWISDFNGEGGLFQEAKLEEAIKEFYSDNF